MLVVKLIIDGHISSIFSTQCKFINVRFYTNIDKEKVTNFTLGGIYGKTDSIPHYYPMKFKMFRVLATKS